jgi:hypothetical protein
MMGHLQDIIKNDIEMDNRENILFEDFDNYIRELELWTKKENDYKETRVYHKYIPWFLRVFMQVYLSISIKPESLRKFRF